MKRLPVIFSVVGLSFSVPVLSAQEKKKTPRAEPVPEPAPVVEPAAASSSLDATVRSRIESFFTLLKEGRTADSYRKLFEGSSIAKERPELMGQLVDTTTAVMEKCGKIESTELLRVRSAGRYVREAVFMVNCQKRPMRWTVYAYFGEGRWQILDTNVELEPRAFFEPRPAAPEKE